ncbi:hypothetical protein HDU97_006605 [Phlyctochytrium planicorne]|nr:hypothetical protein HDU97_006605 [Phlyctochytrium planicorne]
MTGGRSRKSPSAGLRHLADTAAVTSGSLAAAAEGVSLSANPSETVPSSTTQQTQTQTPSPRTRKKTASHSQTRITNANANANMHSNPPSSPGLPQVYNANYKTIPVFQLNCLGVILVRRRDNNQVNLTQLQRFALRIDPTTQRNFLTLSWDDDQWIDLASAISLAKELEIYGYISPLLQDIIVVAEPHTQAIARDETNGVSPEDAYVLPVFASASTSTSTSESNPIVPASEPCVHSPRISTSESNQIASESRPCIPSPRIPTSTISRPQTMDGTLKRKMDGTLKRKTPILGEDGDGAGFGVVVTPDDNEKLLKRGRIDHISADGGSGSKGNHTKAKMSPTPSTPSTCLRTLKFPKRVVTDGAFHSSELSNNSWSLPGTVGPLTLDDSSSSSHLQHWPLVCYDRNGFANGSSDSIETLDMEEFPNLELLDNHRNGDHSMALQLHPAPDHHFRMQDPRRESIGSMASIGSIGSEGSATRFVLASDMDACELARDEARAAVRKYVEEVDALRSEKETLRNDARGSRAKILELEKVVEDLMKQKEFDEEVKRAHIDVLKGELAVVNARNLELASNREFRYLQERHPALQIRYEACRAELAKVKEENERLLKDLGVKNAENERLNGVVDTQLRDLEETLATVRLCQETRRELADALRELERSRAQCEELRRLYREVEEAREGEVRAVKDVLEAVEKELEETMRGKEDAERRLQGVETEMHSGLLEIATLRMDVMRAGATDEQRLKEVEEWKDRCAAIEKVLELERKEAKNNEEVKKLREEIEVEKKKLEQLDDVYKLNRARWESDRQELNERYRDACRTVATERAAAGVHRHNLENAEIEIAEMNGRIARLRDEAFARSNELVDAHKTVEDQTKTIAGFEEEMIKMGTALNEANAQVDVRNAQLLEFRDCRDKLTSCEAELLVLRGRLERFLEEQEDCKVGMCIWTKKVKEKVEVEKAGTEEEGKNVKEGEGQREGQDVDEGQGAVQDGDDGGDDGGAAPAA